MNIRGFVSLEHCHPFLHLWISLPYKARNPDASFADLSSVIWIWDGSQGSVPVSSSPSLQPEQLHQQLSAWNAVLTSMLSLLNYDIKETDTTQFNSNTLQTGLLC